MGVIGDLIFGGNKGQSARIATAQDTRGNSALSSVYAQNAAKNNGQLKDILAKASMGQMSLADAMKNISQLQAPQNGVEKAMGGLTGAAAQNPLSPESIAVGRAQLDQKTNPQANYSGADLRSAALDSLATDPIMGSRFAANEVATSPLTKGLFGEGGLQDQAIGRYGELNGQFDSIGKLLDSDRDSLMGKDQSYGLTDNDLQAYGQAKDMAARQFGQAGQSLSQQLADRGLGSSSAPAAQMFSGALGSQNEQLAQAQLNIAQSRVKTAQDLAQARTNADLQRQSTLGGAIGTNNGLIGNLGNLGQTAVQNQFGRQLAGSENTYNQNAGAAGLGMMNQGLQQNVNNSQFGQQQSTKTPSLGDALTSGIVNGVSNGASSAVSGGMNSLFKSM